LKDVHEIFPAFVISMLTYLIISLLTSNRKPDEEHLEIVFGKNKNL